MLICAVLLRMERTLKRIQKVNLQIFHKLLMKSSIHVFYCNSFYRELFKGSPRIQYSWHPPNLILTAHEKKAVKRNPHEFHWSPVELKLSKPSRGSLHQAHGTRRKGPTLISRTWLDFQNLPDSSLGETWNRKSSRTIKVKIIHFQVPKNLNGPTISSVTHHNFHDSESRKTAEFFQLPPSWWLLRRLRPEKALKTFGGWSASPCFYFRIDSHLFNHILHPHLQSRLAILLWILWSYFTTTQGMTGLWAHGRWDFCSCRFYVHLFRFSGFQIRFWRHTDDRFHGGFPRRLVPAGDWDIWKQRNGPGGGMLMDAKAASKKQMAWFSQAWYMFFMACFSKKTEKIRFLVVLSNHFITGCFGCLSGFLSVLVGFLEVTKTKRCSPPKKKTCQSLKKHGFLSNGKYI